MRVDFFFDPTCPWCWLTSRWITEVEPHRNLDVTWRSFSLAIKNEHPLDGDPTQESPLWGLEALRVVEAARRDLGNEAVGALYTEYGARYHHDRERFPLHRSVVEKLGMSSSLAKASLDENLDEVVRSSMTDALALAGDDVGVPTIVYGGEVAYFGPVMSPAPSGDGALALWDSLANLATMTDGFYELKRTREVRPIFGDRPA